MKVTRWFSIDDDGQPVRPGWYENLYEHDEDLPPEESGEMGYWDGSQWLWGPEEGATAFGNSNTRGERWRGLSAPPK
jgi:hypothetical protein